MATEYAVNLVDTLTNYFSLSNQADEVKKILVRVANEEDNQAPEFDCEDQYYNQFEVIKSEGEDRLKLGESVLSLIIGASVVSSQSLNLDYFEIMIFDYTISFLIQIMILVLSVSIAYRVLVLDMLTFDRSNEFSSLPEMSTALIYQKAVAKISIIKFLTMLVVLAVGLINTKSEVIEHALSLKYRSDVSPTEWVQIMWEYLQSRDK
jgi:hypothetical protein